MVGFDIATGDDILDAEAVERAMVDCDGVAHLAMLMGREHPRDQVFAKRHGRHLERAGCG